MMSKPGFVAVMSLIGAILGATASILVPTCAQEAEEVDGCDDCYKNDAGTPPAGWVFDHSMTNSCQQAGQCKPCCMVVEASVSGTGAEGVIIENPVTGDRKEDFTGPTYILTMDIESACLQEQNTFGCATVAGLFVTTVHGGKIRCYRLNCYSCEEST